MSSKRFLRKLLVVIRKFLVVKEKPEKSSKSKNNKSGNPPPVGQKDKVQIIKLLFTVLPFISLILGFILIINFDQSKTQRKCVFMCPNNINQTP